MAGSGFKRLEVLSKVIICIERVGNGGMEKIKYIGRLVLINFYSINSLKRFNYLIIKLIKPIDGIDLRGLVWKGFPKRVCGSSTARSLMRFR